MEDSNFTKPGKCTAGLVARTDSDGFMSSTSSEWLGSTFTVSLTGSQITTSWSQSGASFVQSIDLVSALIAFGDAAMCSTPLAIPEFAFKPKLSCLESSSLFVLAESLSVLGPPELPAGVSLGFEIEISPAEDSSSEKTFPSSCISELEKKKFETHISVFYHYAECRNKINLKTLTSVPQ